MVSAESDMKGDIALCHRLPVMLVTLVPLLKGEVSNFSVFPDMSPERVSDITVFIIPLHILESDIGSAIHVWDFPGF